MSALAVRVEDVAERHIAPYAALSHAEYGDSAVADPGHLRWKFLENPAGPSVGIHLFASDTLVGRLVAQPRRFVGGTRTVTAAYMVDLVIHRQHRGMKALAALARGLREIRERFDLVLVTPNPAGTAVWETFVKLPGRFDLRLHAAPVRPLELAATLVSKSLRFAAPAADGAWRTALHGAAALRGRSRIRLDPNWPEADELGTMLAAAARNGTPHGERTAAFMAWRFRTSPIFRYECLWLREGSILLGCVVTRRTRYRGYDTRFVMDALGAGVNGDAWRGIAWELIRRDARAGGAELLLIMANTAVEPIATLARVPFVRVPVNVVPQRTTVFADWWTDPAFELSAAGIALTLADCDMI